LRIVESNVIVSEHLGGPVGSVFQWLHQLL
jgi:hypothetical protein